MAYTDRETLERLFEERLAGPRCRCGAPLPRNRIRCENCPPPPLPAVYVEARQRLRERAGHRGAA